MRLYCVMSWITTEKKRRHAMGISFENTERKQDYYTKHKFAVAEYMHRVKEMERELSCSFRGERRTGHVKLFVPYVEPITGHLMDWQSEPTRTERRFEKCDS